MKQRFLQQFAALLASLAIASLSFAAPPASEAGPLRRQQKSLEEFTNISGMRARVGASLGHLKLDLRAPDPRPPESTPASATADGNAADGNRSQFKLPIGKAMSPAEALATKVQREGVPFARLWENKSALVSVGLNQKGHLGLWLIQKTH